MRDDGESLPKHARTRGSKRKRIGRGTSDTANQSPEADGRYGERCEPAPMTRRDGSLRQDTLGRKSTGLVNPVARVNSNWNAAFVRKCLLGNAGVDRAAALIAAKY
jgi:hypothetical protein